MAEVHRNGAAYKDGRLRKGDVILAVNEISFRGICWKNAVKILKESESPLKLLILRENPQKLFTTSYGQLSTTSSDLQFMHIVICSYFSLSLSLSLSFYFYMQPNLSQFN